MHIWTYIHTHHPPFVFKCNIYMHITVYISVVSSLTCSWLCFPSWALSYMYWIFCLLNNVKFLNIFIIAFCLYVIESPVTNYLLLLSDYLGIYVEQYRGQHISFWEISDKLPPEWRMTSTFLSFNLIEDPISFNKA